MADAAEKRLTPMQDRFVHEYLIDLNATAAYKRAGYKAEGNAAEAAASRLLSNVKVKQAVVEAQKKAAAKMEIKAETVLKEYLRIAFSDIGDILDLSGDQPQLRIAKDISKDARQAIASMKVRRIVEGKGEHAREVEVTEFKLWDKLNALEKLAKHLGLLKERIELSGLNGEPIEFIEVPRNANPVRESNAT